MLSKKDFFKNNAKLPSGRVLPNDTPDNSANKFSYPLSTVDIIIC